MTSEAPKSLWDRMYQVGVVVRDMDRAVRFYEQLGIGPFVDGPSAQAIDRKINGRLEPDALLSGKIARMGAIEFELLQPVRGRTIQREFLETKGEGVIHLCGYTDDLERDIAVISKRGYPTISSAHFSDGGSFAYFDTREVGGIVLELFQPGSKFK